MGEVAIAAGRVWVKVSAARAWRPTEIGAEIIGTFLGVSDRPGWIINAVRLETGGILTVSGVVAANQFAVVEVGALVRVVFKGEQTSLAGRTYRDFDVYIAKDVTQ